MPKQKNEKSLLLDFLNSRWIDTNRHKDFRTHVQFPVAKIDDRNNYEFEFKSSKYKFGKLRDDGTAGKINDDRFQIISCQGFTTILTHTSGIICSDNDNLLILPFFNSVFFYAALNVFVCSSQTNVVGDNINGIYNLYYFDVKGRFLRTLSGHYNQRPPKLGFIDNHSQEVIDIKMPVGYAFSKIITVDLFIISNTNGFGLCDNTGHILLDCLYKKIIVNNTFTLAFVEGDAHVIKLNLTTLVKEDLKFDKLDDSKNGFLRVVNTKVSEVPKYGIIDSSGITILHPEFDYIEYTASNNRFKSYSGTYEWNWTEDYDDIFNLYMDPKSWKYSEFYGVLEDGKWGIVDAQNNVILNYEFDWIEELSEHYYLVNKGGKLYSYRDGDVKKDLLSVFGGTWNISDKNGHILNDDYSPNINEVIDKLNINNSNEFNLRTDKNAIKIKPQ